MNHVYDVNCFANFWELIDQVEHDLLPRVKEPEIWSIADVVDHLVDAELQSYLRFRSILFDPVPIIANHDEQRWQEGGRSHYTIADAKVLIDGIRRANKRLLDAAEEGSLDQSGMHTTAGVVTLRDLIRIYDEHVETHRRQVKRLLANLSNPQTKASTR